MTQSEECPPSMEGALSHTPDVQLESLLAIEDDVIGHPLRKSVYFNNKFLRSLIELVQDESTQPDVRIRATIVLGSLFHGTGLNPPFSRFLTLRFGR